MNRPHRFALAMMPHDLPPWTVVYQQTQRWIAVGVFEAMVHDLRTLVRLATGRSEQPSAAIFDGRTLHSTPESGARAGDDGHKRKRGSQVHMAVDTLGHLLARHIIFDSQHVFANDMMILLQKTTWGEKCILIPGT